MKTPEVLSYPKEPSPAGVPSAPTLKSVKDIPPPPPPPKRPFKSVNSDMSVTDNLTKVPEPFKSTKTSPETSVFNIEDCKYSSSK